MITIQNNIPKLRFSEFSEEWKVNPFKELVKINQGLQIAINDRYTIKEEGFLFYITNEFLRDNSEKKYFIKNAPESVICSEDDVLMTRTGNTGKVVTNVKGAFHNNFFKISYPPSIHKVFLVNFLNLTHTQNLILRLAGTSTIPDLNHSDFYKIKFTYPSLPEQQKIASFLTAIDTKIEKLTKKLSRLKQYKKGVMQQIFSQQLRFKDENGNAYPDWAEKKLGEVSENIMYGLNSSAIAFNGKDKYIRITDIDENNNKYLPKPLTSPDGKLDDSYLVKNGDILFARTGASVGKSYLYNENDGNIYFAGFLIRFSITKACPHFIFYHTQTCRYEKWVKTMSMRSGQPGLNAEEYKSFQMDLPCMEEQQKIAAFLRSIDTKIELVNTQLENTQQFKKGLLQQMFV